MKSKLAILALAGALASPFSALGRTMIGRAKPVQKQDYAEAAEAIAKAEAKRQRKQQKRIAHAAV